MWLFLFVWVCPGHIYGPLLKPRVLTYGIPITKGWLEKYEITKLKKIEKEILYEKFSFLNASFLQECLLEQGATRNGPEASAKKS